jgi:glutathione synthase/RimK-type ligase-like ATP-grasp enzyme
MSNNESPVREFSPANRALAVLVENRYLEQAQPAGLIQALRARGHYVEIIVAKANSLVFEDDTALKAIDLLIARGRSQQLLSALSWAETRGISTVNTSSAIAAVHNKVEMTARLTSAGVATPPTVFGSPRQIAPSIGRDLYPILVKPVYGDNGEGIQLIYSPEELERVRGPVVLAQRLVPNNGFDLKLYCIGELTYAVRKPCSVACLQPVMPAGARAATGAELIPVTQEMSRIARRCAHLFGLELFGVDILETSRGLVVIEVNDFPNYTAVPAADELIADYLYARMRQEKKP